MGRRRGPRIKNRLPRGGLGWLGWIPALGSFAAAWFARTDVPILVCALAIPLCVWCALGLRKDDSAGESSDHYVDEESWVWSELLAGNFENPVRRQSNGMVLLGVLGLALALCRWLFGWGPLT